MHGDTSKVLFGMGTYGSRSIAVGGTAIVKALDKIIAKGKKIAAHLLEAAEADIEYDRGEFKVAGTDRKKMFGEVAFAAYVPHNYPHDKLEPGLNENAFYDPTNFTFPAGTYVCEVEVDRDTGATQIDRVHRGGRLRQDHQPDDRRGPGARRPRAGHRPGAHRGLPLRRHRASWSPARSWTTASRAPATCRSFKVDTRETPCTHNPLGVKGCGEAGAIGAPAAVMNAITDALGVKDVPMPATAQTVWRSSETSRLGERAMHAFEYHRPASTQGRARPAARRAKARYLAGGQSLVQAMKLRLSSPSDLIDLGTIKDLAGIKASGSAVEIGAMTRHADVAASKDVQKAIPALAALAGIIGDRQVRHMGTLGGSLANSDPAADYPAAVLGLGATITTNKRKIEADKFFKGLLRDRARAGRAHHLGVASRCRSAPPT